MTELTNFSTVVLFARENASQPLSAALFRRIIGLATSYPRFDDAKWTASGSVHGPKDETLQPRAGVFSEAALERWCNALTLGRLIRFNLSVRQNHDREPRLFIQIADPRLGVPPSKGWVVPRLCVVVAKRCELVDDAFDKWLDYACRLAGCIGAINGFVEESRPWSFRFGKVLTEKHMDLRYHELPGIEYLSGSDGAMSEFVSRVRKHQFLQAGHLLVSIEKLKSECPLVERVRPCGKSLSLVSFVAGVENDDERQSELSQFIRNRSVPMTRLR
jgi:hypothetical protein